MKNADTKQSDRIEWLHHKPHRDDRASVLAHGGTEEAYWAEVKKTATWSGFLLTRRLADVGRALARGVLGNRSPWN